MKKTLKKNFIRIILSVLILALFPVMNLLATETTMGYDEYFSKERSLISTPSTEVNSDWLRNPTHIYDAVLNFYKAKFPDMTNHIAIGNVYQERVVNGDICLVKLAEGGYHNSATSEFNMYLARGEELSRWNLNTLESEIIFDNSGIISTLYAYDEAVFFQAGNTIYRYHVYSEQIDAIISDEALFLWNPVSNQTVRCIVSNPEYIEAVTAAGVDEYELINNIDLYSAWLNQRFNLTTTPEDEIFSESELRTLLIELGIMPTNIYYYNTELNQKSEQYVVPAEETPQSSTLLYQRTNEVIQPMSGENDVYAFNTTDYATGSYFTNNGSACPSHSTSTSNCRTYLGAKQCEGYARYLFYTNTGVSVYGGQYLKSTLPDNTDPNKMADYFQAAKKPMIVRFYTTSAQSSSITHTIYVYYADESTIRFSHGNADGHCVVINDISKTYNEFTSHFSSFYGFFEVVEGLTAHSHSHGNWKYNAKYHWKTCSGCGAAVRKDVHITTVSPCICGKITTPQIQSFHSILNQKRLTTLN